MGRLYNLTVVHFNPEKREFSLLLNIPRPPYSMLGYNRTVARTNINVLTNIGPGAGGGGRGGEKGEVKKATFPTLLTMIVGKFLELKKEKDNKETIYYIHFLTYNIRVFAP